MNYAERYAALNVRLPVLCPPCGAKVLRRANDRLYDHHLDDGTMCAGAGGFYDPTDGVFVRREGWVYEPKRPMSTRGELLRRWYLMRERDRLAPDMAFPDYEAMRRYEVMQRRVA